MIITTTGIAFSLSSIGLAFCGIRFFKAFEKVGSGERTGMLLSLYFLLTALDHAIMAIGTIFFAKNPEALYATQVIIILFMILLAALALYLFFYILMPKISQWPALFVIAIFGLYVIWLAIVSHPLPVLITNHSIGWSNSTTLDVFMNLLLLIGIGALFPVFLKSFIFSTSKKTKRIFLFLALLHFAGAVNVTILFGSWFISGSVIRSSIFDYILGAIGLLFITIFLLWPILDCRKKIFPKRSS